MPVKAAASAAPKPRVHLRSDRNRPFKSDEANRHFASNNHTTTGLTTNTNGNNNNSNNNITTNKLVSNGTSSGAVIRAQVISTAPAPSGKSFLEALRTTRSQREAASAAAKADVTPVKETAVTAAEETNDSPGKRIAEAVETKEHKPISTKATPSS